MKTRSRTGWALALIAAGALVWSLQQRAEIAALQARSRGTEPAVGPGTAGPRDVGSVAPVPEAPSAQEKSELLALRAKATELRGRQRLSAAVAAEHRRLEERRDAVAALAARGMPKDYLKRDQARNRGCQTPEAALETFLWAMHAADTNVFLTVVPARSREGLAEEFANEGAKKYFDRHGRLPGYRLVGRRDEGPDAAILDVELAPGETSGMRFRREADGWVMEGF